MFFFTFEQSFLSSSSFKISSTKNSLYCNLKENKREKLDPDLKKVNPALENSIFLCLCAIF